MAIGQVVNFIADPNEWMTPVVFRDPEWQRRYKIFRFRLHWLLLWNSQVRIFDSFFLFNRHIEQWFSELSLISGAAQRISSGASPALSVAIRAGFPSLSEVFDQHMLRNPEYRWYFDGAPSRGYVSSLDSTFSSGAKVAYDGSGFPKTLRDFFCGAFERSPSNPQIYADSERLRQLIPPATLGTIAHLVEGHENGWRRSILNDMLGFGIDASGRLMPCHPDLKHLSPHVRDRLRRLVDSCWCWAINRALGDLPSRYPGQVPPRTLAIFRDDYAAGLGLSETSSLADWTEVDLLTRKVGSIGVSGDLPQLIRSFGDLSIEQVLALRERPEFRSYRSLYEAFDMDVVVRGPQAFTDRKRLQEIANAALRCLESLGSLCAVRITADPLGGIFIRFCTRPLARRVIAAGLAVTMTGAVNEILKSHSISQPSSSLTKGVEEFWKSLVADAGLAWLSMRLTGSGTDEDPVRVRATCLGPVATPSAKTT